MEFTTENLMLDHTEKNVWLDGNIDYNDCYERYYKRFHHLEDLEKELKRADINTVCQKELLHLKSNVDVIRYRDVMGKRHDWYIPIDKYQWQCLSINQTRFPSKII